MGGRPRAARLALQCVVRLPTPAADSSGFFHAERRRYSPARPVTSPGFAASPPTRFDRRRPSTQGLGCDGNLQTPSLRRPAGRAGLRPGQSRRPTGPAGGRAAARPRTAGPHGVPRRRPVRRRTDRPGRRSLRAGGGAAARLEAADAVSEALPRRTEAAARRRRRQVRRRRRCLVAAPGRDGGGRPALERPGAAGGTVAGRRASGRLPAEAARAAAGRSVPGRRGTRPAVGAAGSGRRLRGVAPKDLPVEDKTGLSCR